MQHGSLSSAPPMEPTALADLLRTVRALWPDSPVAVTDDARPGRRLHPLPNRSAVRLLVPGTPRAAGSALRRYSAALTRREVLTRRLAATAARVVGPHRLSHGAAITIAGDGGSIVEHLSEVLGREVQVALTIGNARVNRKPVLQVFDGAGHTLAFAKVGLSDETRDLIRHEADSLEQLAGLVPRVRLPEVLAFTHWRGHPVLTMSALEARPPRRGDAVAPLSHMAAFSLALGHATAELPEVPQWRRLRAALPATDRLGLGLLADRIEAAAERLPRLVVGAWHGDWTTWNMARSRTSELLLWDLERFERGAVHGLDAFHFEVNRERDWRAGGEQLLGAITRAWKAGGQRRSGRLVGAVYLAVIAGRYLAADGSPLAGLIQRRLDDCVAALRVWVRGLA